MQFIKCLYNNGVMVSDPSVPEMNDSHSYGICNENIPNNVLELLRVGSLMRAFVDLDYIEDMINTSLKEKSSSIVFHFV